eukprot:8934961-Karenia_brevis.AAC.1
MGKINLGSAGGVESSGGKGVPTIRESHMEKEIWVTGFPYNTPQEKITEKILDELNFSCQDRFAL